LENFFNSEGFTNDWFNTTAGVGLKNKGFVYEIENNINTFINKMNSYDIIWIISDHVEKNMSDFEPFRRAVLNYHQSGRGIYVWGDNQPYYLHANEILPSLSNIKLFGNTPGQKTLSISDNLKTGTILKNHLITTSVENLFEGITICYPENNNNGKMKVLAISTDGNPCILFQEGREENGIYYGRVVVDCAFTKLYCNFDTAGTERYISNATAWLVDV